jgi:hypothetical protein
MAVSNPALWALGESDGKRFSYGPVPPGAYFTFDRMIAVSYIGQFYVPGVPRPLSDAAIERRRIGARTLGSGLIDQSQKMTVAAMQMADMKVWAHLS